MRRLNFSVFRKGLHFSLVAPVAALWLTVAIVAQAQPVIQSVLYNFAGQPDGASPYGPVVLGSNHALYGTTKSGGPSGYGTVFKVNRDGTGYLVLHSFTNSPDGANPYAGLIQASDGMLYGTTYAGGAYGFGMVFKIGPFGSDYTIIHSFTNNLDGARPYAALMQGNDGALYGTTYVGGANNYGAAFRINLDGGGFQILHTFTNSPDGANPVGRLLQASDGMIYGTTEAGGDGVSPLGTVFKMSTNGSDYAVLHSFNFGGSDGILPEAGLIQGSDGALYGTAANARISGGGSSGFGTIFMINTNGGGFTVLHSFTGNLDGSIPFGELAQGVGNVLYGTTYSGGTMDHGTVFKINPDGGGYNVLVNFGLADGASPYSGLVQGPSSDTNGVLYGTTFTGGAQNTSGGTVFALIVNPALSITPVTSQTASNQTAIFWPAWALNYTLQSSTNLTSTNWVNVTTGVPVTGVQVTSTNSSVFYRLVAP